MASYNPSEVELSPKRTLNLLLRLEASLIALLTFSAGAAPRLIPVLFGLLGLIAAFLIAGSYSLQAPEDVRVLAKCALAGLLTGAAFLLIEIVFDDAIMRFI